MNLCTKGFPSNNDTEAKIPNRVTSLNPNAAEFVPSSYRSLLPTHTRDSANVDAAGTSAKAILDHSTSSVSNESDDEAHSYWRCQLPDDITPDFRVTENQELHMRENLSLAGLSLHAENDASKLSSSANVALDRHHNENMRYPTSSCMEESGLASYLNISSSHWNKTLPSGNHDRRNGRSEPHENTDASIINDALKENAMLDRYDVDPLNFLVSRFPGFAAESLAGLLYANGCDLSLTIEMLIQLEMQSDGGFQNLHSKTHSAPDLTTLDFPALPILDCQNTMSRFAADNLQSTVHAYPATEKTNQLSRSSNLSDMPSKGANFASTVRKLAQESGEWKCERNGSSDISVGISRKQPLLASIYNGHGGSLSGSGNGPQKHRVSHAVPVWLETGEAVASMYSGVREEARDHARIRNACFEQARQAYLIGNKALARELSIKGQLHSLQMKAAHGKARETIFSQRNPVPAEFQGYIKGHDPIIDLHGLHVSEAIHMLKHELSILRNTARSAGKRLQVLICVGTGHHTKGSRTAARLPIAVEKYLLEEERLDYSEPQPGLLRVVIY